MQAGRCGGRNHPAVCEVLRCRLDAYIAVVGARSSVYGPARDFDFGGRMVGLEEAVEVWLENADNPLSGPSPQRLRARRLPVWNALWAALQGLRDVFVPVPGDGA